MNVARDRGPAGSDDDGDWDMKLSVVIVNWNTRDLLLNCLTSVYDYPPKEQFEVWVVDNASDDGSATAVPGQFPEVRLIRNEENVGFAQANNQAMELCRGRYILLLNPDTEVKPGALQTLVQFMDTNCTAGVAGSRLLNPDGTLQTSCHPSPTLLRELWRLFHMDKLYPYGRYHMHKWNTTDAREVAVIQGASLILRQEALDEIGRLDTRYFMYSEEVDLCHRLRLAGWQLYWVPQSQVVHYGGQSTKQVASEMFMQLYLSKLRFFRKHHGEQAARNYKLILMAASAARLLLSPFAWLLRPPKRDENLLLARYYFRLLVALLQT